MIRCMYSIFIYISYIERRRMKIAVMLLCGTFKTRKECKAM